jgi:hypothetical protein
MITSILTFVLLTAPPIYPPDFYIDSMCQMGGSAVADIEMNGYEIVLNAGDSLHFGPRTASYAMVYATGTQVQMKLGDDSNYAGIDLGLTRVYHDLQLYHNDLFLSASGGGGSTGFRLGTNPTYDQAVVSSHADSGNQLLLVPAAYRSKDFDVAVPTDPIFCAFATVDPDSDNTNHACMSHNQTNAVLTVGSGSLDVSSADTLIPPRQINASPTEPATCDASIEGAWQYVDDTDDTAYGRNCQCANLDGTGYDWRDMGDVVGTACPFY